MLASSIVLSRVIDSCGEGETLGEGEWLGGTLETFSVGESEQTDDLKTSETGYARWRLGTYIALREDRQPGFDGPTFFCFCAQGFRFALEGRCSVSHSDLMFSIIALFLAMFACRSSSYEFGGLSRAVGAAFIGFVALDFTEIFPLGAGAPISFMSIGCSSDVVT